MLIGFKDDKDGVCEVVVADAKNAPGYFDIDNHHI